MQGKITLVWFKLYLPRFFFKFKFSISFYVQNNNGKNNNKNISKILNNDDAGDKIINELLIFLVVTWFQQEK